MFFCSDKSLFHFFKKNLFFKKMKKLTQRVRFFYIKNETITKFLNQMDIFLILLKKNKKISNKKFKIKIIIILNFYY